MCGKAVYKGLKWALAFSIWIWFKIPGFPYAIFSTVIPVFCLIQFRDFNHNFNESAFSFPLQKKRYGKGRY